MADLLSVVVGGALAVGGGGVTQWMLQRAKEKSDRKRLRAEKFEQLLSTIFAHKHWLELYRDVKLFGEQRELTEPPIARALALATAYLPELAEDVSNVETASMKFELWILGAGRKRLSGDKNFDYGIDDSYKQFLGAVSKMMKNAIQYQKDNQI